VREAGSTSSLRRLGLRARGTSLGSVLLFVAAACGGGASPGIAPAATSPVAQATPRQTPAATVAASVPPTSPPRTLSPEEQAAVARKQVARALDAIDPVRLSDHVKALTDVGSRDPRHPGHQKAIAYIRDQLGALGFVDPRSPAYRGLGLDDHRAVYQGIPLTNIFAVVEPSGPVASNGWIMICAHYDSVATNTPGWRPSADPAPGADDNATGTAALLEYARVLAAERSAGHLRKRVTLAFFDGEELFFKGSAAYVQSLPSPGLYSHVLNIDMVGFNPLADRLDLIWYGRQSDALRDRVKDANARYEIGVAPLVEVFANDPSRYILDTAPFGVAGVPAVTLTQRYGEADASYPGNAHFHTVNDTPDKLTNPRLWLKAAKLTLAVAIELAMIP